MSFPELDTTVVEEQDTLTDETNDDTPTGDGGEGDDGAAPPATPQQTAVEQNWWETPEGLAYLDNIRNQERQQARLEVETEVSVRAEQAKVAAMTDEEFGAYVRETQEKTQSFQESQITVARQLANKVWNDLVNTPDFALLSREEQAEVYYRPEGGNPYIAAARLIAEKKANQIIAQRTAASGQAAENLETAGSQGSAPPIGVTAPGANPVGYADWDDLFAARDKKRGYEPFRS